MARNKKITAKKKKCRAFANDVVIGIRIYGLNTSYLNFRHEENILLTSELLTVHSLYTQLRGMKF